MEQKTIGKFITALRKANGMTQKELAEKLNVSDKTVSRWERDEGAPDLSVIPVIAEIFDVTCDELLRGERKSPAQRAEAAEKNEPTAKGEKQRQRLLKTSLSQYQTRTYIAIGISAVGMIAALIGNLAFLRAVLGFLSGAVFFTASIVCQAVFLNRAFFSVEDAELEPSELSQFKRRAIRLAQISIGLTVAFIGFTFPLIFVDAFVGLGPDNMLVFSLPGMALFLLIYALVLYFLNASLLKRGVYSLSEKEAAVYHYNHKLKRICAIVLVILLAITFAAHQFATTIWGPFFIMDGITFHDYDSFIAYMEQDIPYQSNSSFLDGTVAPAPEQVGPVTYYDEYGNEVSEEQARTRKLEDKNGNVVCEYIDRNESVISLQYSAKDGTVLPITVFTSEALQEARETAAVRHVIFAGAYCVEIMAVLIFYFIKRAKKTRT